MDAPPSCQDTLRCPTCRALQPWAESCRRCQSDLGLLLEAAEAVQYHRRQCLRQLDAGDPFQALQHARRCHQLRPGAESRRLLALCALRTGDWPAAIALARGSIP